MTIDTTGEHALDLPDDEPEAAPQPTELTLRLSKALMTKLQSAARDEGIPLEAFLSELLAEGVTLRAWEIMERKSAMRGGNAQQPQSQGNARYGQGGNGRPGNGRPQGNGGHGHGNRSQGGQRPMRNNNAWMEDKAAFLEYVRNQEKQHRR